MVGRQASGALQVVAAAALPSPARGVRPHRGHPQHGQRGVPLRALRVSRSEPGNGRRPQGTAGPAVSPEPGQQPVEQQSDAVQGRLLASHAQRWIPSHLHRDHKVFFSKLQTFRKELEPTASSLPPVCPSSRLSWRLLTEAPRVLLHPRCNTFPETNYRGRQKLCGKGVAARKH
uniref:Putative secreted protein n=1 Tax=Ixodes scapularis TaxID=6945 RepID=A0A4D5RC68_IXOSC